jgi:hypothetical protein
MFHLLICFNFNFFYLYFRHVMHFSKMIQENQTDKTTVRVQRLDLNWYITHDSELDRPRRRQQRDKNKKQQQVHKFRVKEEKKEQRPCICVIGISILSFSVISILDFETVLTVYFIFIAWKISFLISL